MFAVIPVGTYLPPMVVYKLEDIYCEWVCGGPNNTVHSCKKSGLFDSATLESWFFKQFMASAQGLEGPIALIGDNFGSHFSPSVLKYCNIHNISFIYINI